MKRHFIVTVISVFVIGSFAQKPIKVDVGKPIFNQLWEDYQNFKKVEEEQASNYVGNPYRYEVDKGIIQLSSGEQIDNLILRYNVYKDQVEIKKNDRYYVVPKDKNISKFIFADHIIVLKVFDYSGKRRLGYLESIVDESACNQFVKHNIFLSPAKEQKPFQEAQPAEFIDKKNTVYISFNDNLLNAIKKKSDFLVMIPDHNEEIENFIKKNKIKFHKPESIKELVQFYNTL
ncbi:hypothetical protein [Carboxylicivirga marina]|uniref:hypothetical protein n=1 Tax=Carboxylicivirga marina TaxID=2800988 RepID=UPI0025957D6D|nr:hypothetical protein [uncultured Carboxylicivirga sp.]